MDKSYIQAVRRETEANRRYVPKQNLPKFDVEANEYFKYFNQAENAVQAFQLLEKWRKRMMILRSCPRCYLAPPQLLRLRGEKASDYLHRCEEAKVW